MPKTTEEALREPTKWNINLSFSGDTGFVLETRPLNRLPNGRIPISLAQALPENSPPQEKYSQKVSEWAKSELEKQAEKIRNEEDEYLNHNKAQPPCGEYNQYTGGPLATACLTEVSQLQIRTTQESELSK